MTRYLLTAVSLALIGLTALAPAALSAKEERKLPDHSIEITIDIPSRAITGTDAIRVEGVKTVSLLLREGSEVTGVTLGAEKLGFTVERLEDEQANGITVKLPEGAEGVILVGFRGSFPSVENAKDNIRRGVAYVEDGVIGEEGVFLPSGPPWYPRVHGPHTASLTISIDEGYRTIAEGELAEARVSNGKKPGKKIERWEITEPVDGVNLVAGRYVVEEEGHGGVKILTYFFEKDEKLSRVYMDKTKEYLDLYSRMIAPYPYKKFAVVENFLPTGYGMPSFTLLGSSVLRLPFIPDTSLGHEIAHSWWGNSVFLDGSEGNWVEALTTYAADYLYERKKGGKEAKEFRLSKLRGYRNFAFGKDISLNKFTDATTPASRAVGYNKGVMVFNMLEAELGSDAFDRGLKKLYKDFAFRRASWTDIRASFEAASGADLGWFFGQWVQRAGGPELRLGEVSVRKGGKGHIVSFGLIQETTEPYMLKLPVVFRTSEGELRENITVKEGTEQVKIELASAPLDFTIDPGYEVFRILRPGEIPPSFGACFGDAKTVAVIPSEEKARKKYGQAAALLSKDFGFEVATDAGAGTRDFTKESSLILFGWPEENRVARLAGAHLSRRMAVAEETFSIEGRTFDRAGTTAAVAVKNAEDPAKTLCFFMSGAGEPETLKAAMRLRYFSESGYVVFPGGANVEEGRFEGENALSHEIVRE
ncbi:MAG: M1 family aminopeptidase [Deltaproteobacteria bacterium]|nr:M1 family aminopeptidase [Deltaproteobacteria bacterium]